MRFMRQRPSGVDKQVPVFEFAFGLKEMELLKEGIDLMIRNTSKVLETIPTRGRMRSISKAIAGVLTNYKNNKL